jgi:hypothetical protein
MPAVHRPLVPFALALGVACGGAEPAGPPAALVAVNAGPFTGTVGANLGAALQVRVTDAEGRNVDGVAVLYAVTAGGGQVTIASVSGNVRSDTTDQDGLAEAVWLLGTEAGEQAVTVTVAGLTPVQFAATAEPGPAAAVVVLEESAFIAPVSSPTDEPLAVRVQDEFGNAVGGVTVAWAALSAGAGVAAASSTADDGGIARVDATLGPAAGIQLFRVTPEGASPDTVGVIAVTAVADPEGDPFATGSAAYDPHDATRFGAVVITDILVLYAGFAGPISPNPSGAPTRTSLIGNYDFDLDGDSLTGLRTLRQCPPLSGPPLGFGVDAFVELDPQSGFLAGLSGLPEGAVPLLLVDSVSTANPCTGAGTLWVVVATYQPTTVTIAIPLTVLEDDGALGITTLFAHPGTQSVTDVVPDSLAWDFVPTTAVVAGAPAAALDPWDFLPVRRPPERPVRVEGMPLLRAAPRR